MRVVRARNPAKPRCDVNQAGFNRRQETETPGRYRTGARGSAKLQRRYR